MKTGIAGLLVLLLTVITLVLPGCAGVQDHWTIPDNQAPFAEVPAEEAPPPVPVDRDSSRETSVQGEARPQREEAERREAEVRENARRQEEVRRLLEELEATHRRAEAEERSRQEAESRRFSGDQAGADTKPRYYVVRPGDTFNSIAADPRIYNNRSEWFTLYEANRNKLKNPDNPHLILPGMIIEIPSITGEVREGTY
jgi:nucleoid-associated protein YgaU